MQTINRLPSILPRRLAAVLVLLTLTRPAGAHEGPPFPIVMDEQVGPFLVSVWTDPDIGTGTFFVVLEPRDGGDLPENIIVKIGVAPVSGRLEEVFYQAESQAVRYGARYFAEVAFDQGEWWDVHVVIDSAAGGGTITSKVEATPDGSIGPLGMVVYLLPFVAVGLLWLKAVLRKRRAAASKPPA
jgi:hypothetical protein